MSDLEKRVAALERNEKHLWSHLDRNWRNSRGEMKCGRCGYSHTCHYDEKTHTHVSFDDETIPLAEPPAPSEASLERAREAADKICSCVTQCLGGVSVLFMNAEETIARAIDAAVAEERERGDEYRRYDVSQYAALRAELEAAEKAVAFNHDEHEKARAELEAVKKERDHHRLERSGACNLYSKERDKTSTLEANLLTAVARGEADKASARLTRLVEAVEALPWAYDSLRSGSKNPALYTNDRFVMDPGFRALRAAVEEAKKQ